MSETAATTHERKELSAEEEQAKTWLEAARSEYNRRYSQKTANATYEEVAPSAPTHLPRGIEAGSMDAEIWAGEQSGDYEEVAVGGPSAHETAEHIKHNNKLGNMGAQIRGTKNYGEIDPKIVASFAELEAQRQEALANQEPDPLATQMATLEVFDII